MSNLAAKIRLSPIEDLFRVGSELEKIVELPLEYLYEFHNHPFRRVPDEKMAELTESIAEHGVLVPGIVRERGAGCYEIIAGHNRWEASKRAGRTSMPVIIKELTDAQATIIMVDSNLQRETLLPSERAYAYRMRLEAVKQLTPDERLATKGRVDTALAEQLGESRNTMLRYIRLTELVPPIMDMVDKSLVGFVAAADGLSYMTKESQMLLVNYIDKHKMYPSGTQADTLKSYDQKHVLNASVVNMIMSDTPTKMVPEKIVLKRKCLAKYFPETYTSEEMEKVIISLLEEWKRR